MDFYLKLTVALLAWSVLAIPAIALMAVNRPDVEDDLDVDLTDWGQ